MQPLGFLLIAAVVGLVLAAFFTRKKTSDIIKPADDNNCRPHEWGTPEAILGKDLSADLADTIKNTDKFSGSVVESFCKGLTCKKCGYISGSNVMVDLKQWSNVVSSFLFTEKERQLVEKYLKRKE